MFRYFLFLLIAFICNSVHAQERSPEERLKSATVTCPPSYSKENVNKLFQERVKFSHKYLKVLAGARVQPGWIKNYFKLNDFSCVRFGGKIFAYASTFEPHNASRMSALLVDIASQYVGVYTTDDSNALLSDGNIQRNKEILVAIGYLMSEKESARSESNEKLEMNIAAARQAQSLSDSSLKITTPSNVKKLKKIVTDDGYIYEIESDVVDKNNVKRLSSRYRLYYNARDKHCLEVGELDYPNVGGDLNFYPSIQRKYKCDINRVAADNIARDEFIQGILPRVRKEIATHPLSQVPVTY